MKILNFGSLNIDYVYTVDHMTREGETQQAALLETYPGGKGLNQSIAIAKAGQKIYHAGVVGADGELLLNTCRINGVDTSLIKQAEEKSGHTIIQIDKNGQNCILVYSGTNGKIDREYVDQILEQFEKGDLIILQNEISMLDYILEQAYKKGMIIVLNPSPLNKKLLEYDLTKVSVFIMNEVEGSAIAGNTEDPMEILNYMKEKYPDAKVVLTLGGEGAYYSDADKRFFQPSFKTEVVDTTAAGDTFTGYFLKGMVSGDPIEEAMQRAACAAAIAVSRKGAAVSIPLCDEVAKVIGLENKGISHHNRSIK